MRSTKAKKNRMHNSAEAKATATPSPASAKDRVRLDSTASFTSSKEAPAMMGILSKNENRAASTRDTPSNSAAVMVIPLRDVPGTNART